MRGQGLARVRVDRGVGVVHQRPPGRSPGPRARGARPVSGVGAVRDPPAPVPGRGCRHRAPQRDLGETVGVDISLAGTSGSGADLHMVLSGDNKDIK